MNELEAAIKRAKIGRTFSKFSNTPAVEAIAADPPEPMPVYPKVVEIKRAVADYFSMDMVGLDCSRNDKHLAHARHIAMYLCKELTLHSFPEIGRRIGGRHHTTVLHAVEKINRILNSDTEISETLENEIDEIKSNIFAAMKNGKT